MDLKVLLEKVINFGALNNAIDKVKLDKGYKNT